MLRIGRETRMTRAQSGERQSAELEDEGTNAYNTKTDIEVTNDGVVVAAIRGTGEVSIVAPRTTTQHPRTSGGYILMR